MEKDHLEDAKRQINHVRKLIADDGLARESSRLSAIFSLERAVQDIECATAKIAADQ